MDKTLKEGEKEMEKLLEIYRKEVIKMVMGNPGRKLYTLTVKPACPICGRDGIDVGRGMIECPIHGYLEKKPLSTPARVSRAN